MGYHAFSVQDDLCVNRTHHGPPPYLSLFFFVSVGKKNKLRLYYLSWLRNKILHNDPEVEKRQGWTSVGDLEGCVHYKVGKYALAGTR